MSKPTNVPLPLAQIVDDHDIEKIVIKKIRRVERVDGPQPITVEVVMETLELNLKRRTKVPNWFPIAGVSFVAFGILAMWASLTSVLPFASNQSYIFNVFVALCVAAGGTFLGGQAIASGAIPSSQSMKENPIKFSTGGGVAIFVIVLLLMFSLNR